LALIIPDLVLGGSRSLSARFLVPCYLSAQVSVAYLIGRGASSAAVAKRKIFIFIAVTLFFGGAVSCCIDSGSEVTLNKGFGKYQPEVARVINQSAHPLLIGEARGGNLAYVLALSHSLDPKVRLQLFGDSITPIAFDGHSEVFVYRPSPSMRRVLEEERNYSMELLHQPGGLWRLKPAAAR
jgi:uncharacterized membrane protein